MRTDVNIKLTNLFIVNYVTLKYSFIGGVNMQKNYFKAEDLAELLRNSAQSKFPERDAILILFCGTLGLTRQEISGLTISDIMNSDGTWKDAWITDKRYAYKGVERKVFMPPAIFTYLDQYVEWLYQLGLSGDNESAYRGFKPDFIFIRNDNKTPFSLLKRNHSRAEGLTSYHTRALDDKLEALLNNSSLIGSTSAAFRDGYIMQLNALGLPITKIMALTGFKTRNSVKKKIERLSCGVDEASSLILDSINQYRHIE